MYQLRGIVGKGCQNRKEDVAYVQWVLRQVRVGGRGVYRGKINGSFASDLDEAIYTLREMQASLRVRVVSSTQGKIYPASSRGLKMLLPPQMQRYTPVPVKGISGVGAILLAGNRYQPPFRVGDTSLPNDDAKELLSIIDRIGFKLGVVTELTGVDLNSSQGYFLIRLAIKGAKRVDLSTGVINEGGGADLNAVERWLVEGTTSPLARGSSKLIPVFERGLCLRTQSYPVLKIALSRKDVDAARWNARFERMAITGADKSYISKLYEYYEEYRLQGKMTPEIKKFFTECFGKAAVPIKVQEELRKARCRIFRDNLDALGREKASLARSLIEISHQYDESVKGGIVKYLAHTYGEELWNLAGIAAGAALVGGTIKVLRQKPIYETPKQAFRREGEDALLGVALDTADNAKGISWVDTALIGLQLAGIALLFVSPVGWLVGGGRLSSTAGNRARGQC
ncbi:hypothetical protein [Kordiimonas sp.]|uniref:hypothetical protein n=1 Tax=Kordiimonas sp. TaxID=1970157 RepID=UPI003A8F07D7